MAGNPYDLTSRELLSILFKEKLKLFLVFVVLCAAVTGYSLLLTPYYEATTRLLVKTGPEFQTRSDANQQIASVPSTTKLEIVNSEIQILTSRDLVEGVINKIGAQRLYPGTTGMDAATRSFEADFTRKFLRGELVDLRNAANKAQVLQDFVIIEDDCVDYF